MTGQEKASYKCNPNGAISMCQCSKDCKLLLTSSSVYPSALWVFGNSFEKGHSFRGDNWVQFSNLSEDKIIGTNNSTA
ncbi:DDB1- and CUL4-associated factor 1, partial [Acropora cervicornis]